MPNPLIPQGTLNRLRGSVMWNDFPDLNVTAPYLGKEGIQFTQEGDSTVYFPTMSGAVTSLEPYVLVAVNIALLKTQSLADAYKRQMELLSTLGDGVVRPDAQTLSPYQLINCSIEGVGALDFAGLNPIYGVRCKGYYLLNSSLWDG